MCLISPSVYYTIMINGSGADTGTTIIIVIMYQPNLT